MGVKKGDYVPTWNFDAGIMVGRAKEDENEDHEFDMEFMDSGSVSPVFGGDECAVIPEGVAKFLWGCMELLPECGDPETNPDGIVLVPDEIMEKINLVGKDGYVRV